MSVLALGPDKYYKIEYNPVTHKVRFVRETIGPHTHIDIEEADYTYTNSNSIFVHTVDGDDGTGDGTTETPYKTLLKGANSCTATITHVIVLNTAFISEDLSTINNAYFSGFWAALGETPTYTTRTLGYTPADANSIFVDKTGNDTTGDGSQATPVLTIAKAITLCDGTHQAVVIMDSGTYDEAPFEFTGNFLGLYAALGESPTVTIADDNSTWTATESTTEFEAGAANYTSIAAMSDDRFVVCCEDTGDTNNGKFTIYNSDLSVDVATTTFDSGSITEIKCRVLSDDAFVISYSDAGPGYFMIYESDGVTVRKASTKFEAGTTANISMTVLSDDSFVVSYRDAGDSNKGKFVIYDSTGTAVKTATEFESGAITQTAIDTLSNDYFIIAYTDAGKGKFVIYDSSGVQVKAETEFESAIATHISICVLPNDNFVISYYNSGDSSDGKYIIYNSIGDIIKQQSEFEADAVYYLDSCVLSDGSFIISFQDLGDSKGKHYKITGLYWTGITVSAASTVNGITFD